MHSFSEVGEGNSFGKRSSHLHFVEFETNIRLDGHLEYVVALIDGDE